MTNVEQYTPTKPRYPGIGLVAKEAIRDGKCNEEALAVVRSRFPEARTSEECIKWYRSKLRSLGEPIEKNSEILLRRWLGSYRGDGSEK